MATPRPTLIGPRVLLRGPLESDRKRRLELGNPPDVAYLLGVDASNIPEMGPELVDRWLSSLADRPEAWVIEFEGSFVGVVNLYDIDRFDGRAEFAINIIDSAARGLGLGQEVIALVLQHSFYALGLHRVHLRVLAHNTAAIRCYEKSGFVHEGTDRESVRMDGRWYDHLRMAILAEEFRRLGG